MRTGTHILNVVFLEIYLNFNCGPGGQVVSSPCPRAKDNKKLFIQVSDLQDKRTPGQCGALLDLLLTAMSGKAEQN